MTLPFDNNPSKRKHQCFVCGVMFEELEQYKDHILEEHEEGREYIKCPRCGYPVRDLKLHYKVKHPGCPLPQSSMMRAIIWKDFSPNKKGKTRKPKFREGWHESTKMGKRFYYRSGYEKDVYECLDKWEKVIAYSAEPFEISYVHEGEPHRYIPDILIEFTDGRKELWEIKPATQTHLPKNKAKWAAAKNACDLRGWGWQVMTEQSINKLKKQIN